MDDGYHSPAAKAARDQMAQRIHDGKPWAFHLLLDIDPARCQRCARAERQVAS